jgi:hypothetical protein
MAASETVQEALDRLLAPVDVSTAIGTVAEEEAMPGSFASPPNRIDVSALFVRLRWSRRLPYKVPRVLAAWAVLIVGVCGLVWLTFSILGLK